MRCETWRCDEMRDMEMGWDASHRDGMRVMEM